jgi:hypothetical protein
MAFFQIETVCVTCVVTTNFIPLLVSILETKCQCHLNDSQIKAGGLRDVLKTTERVCRYQGGNEVVPKVEGKGGGTGAACQ